MSDFRKVWGIYIICLHIFCVAILLESDCIERVGVRLGLYQQPEISSYYNTITTYHKRMDGSIPEGATLFIGDSITQSLATSAVSDLSVNYGIGADTTIGVLNRLPLYKSISTAKAVVIAIGVNDLKRRDNSDIVGNFKKVLDFIPRDKTIVVSAILPVDERVEAVNASNDRIIKLNLEIRELAKYYKNVAFVNSRDLLQESDGNLKKEFHIGDGVHLSMSGYQVWINQLRNALNTA